MSPDFSDLRLKMVDGQLRTTDVTDNRILDAMLRIPRERFVDPRSVPLAYLDEDLALATADGSARFLMEPSPFAKLLQLANVRAGDRVLDLGCATGYSTAVIATLAAEVTGLEQDAGLAARARENLAALGVSNATVVEGDLTKGHPAGAPFDVILVGGAVEVLPPALVAQLANGGRIVAVEGSGNAGVARLTTMTDGAAAGRRGFNAAVKPLPGFERRGEFQF